MIITHARNAAGERRIYLGGKGSLECWIEPGDNGRWSFHVDDAVTGNTVSNADKRAWAIHILMQLAAELDVAPADLGSTPFERIAALHTVNPYDGRRVPTPARRTIDNAFIAAPPGTSRCTDGFDAANFYHRRSARSAK